jgi:hypothetical protein
MIVNNGRIQWVGPTRDLKAPASAEVLELSGAYVMPGIINLHGHVGNTIDLEQNATIEANSCRCVASALHPYGNRMCRRHSKYRIKQMDAIFLPRQNDCALDHFDLSISGEISSRLV